MVDESIVDGGTCRRAQRRQVRASGWTKKRRETFLASLADTCNVRLSVKRVGLAVGAAYPLRHRDPVFARLWDEALAIGYDRLEAMLLQRAIEGVNDIDVAALVDAEADDREEPAERQGGDDDGAGKAPRVPGSGLRASLGRSEVQLALAMLNRRGAKDGLRPAGRKAMGSDEVDALLTRKLDALARRRART